MLPLQASASKSVGMAMGRARGWEEAETSCPHPEAGPCPGHCSPLHPQPRNISCLTGQKPQMDTMVAHGLHGLRTVVLAARGLPLPFCGHRGRGCGHVARPRWPGRFLPLVSRFPFS